MSDLFPETRLLFLEIKFLVQDFEGLSHVFIQHFYIYKTIMG